MLLTLKNIIITLKKSGKVLDQIVNIKNSVNPKIAQLNINGVVVDKPKHIVN